jgi:hypothetical protein
MEKISFINIVIKKCGAIRELFELVKIFDHIVFVGFNKISGDQFFFLWISSGVLMLSISPV